MRCLPSRLEFAILAIGLVLTSCGTRRFPIASAPPGASPAASQPRALEEDRDSKQSLEHEREAESLQERAADHRAGQLEPEDGALESAEYFRSVRMPPGQTEFPYERYEVARRKIDAMRKFSIAHGRELNPSEARITSSRDATTGGWQQIGPGNVGGRTRALLLDPANPQVMYAGGATGGIWKSIDGGQSWNNISSLFATTIVVSIAIDPSNSNTLYAGTGEFFTNHRGSGIYKSTNGGSTWAQLSATRNSNFYYVNKVIVSPNDSRRLYAATVTGLWTSIDAGVTWKQQLPIAISGPIQIGCREMVVRPDQKTDYLFAVCAGTTAKPDYSIYRNTDASGAGVWTAVHTAADMGHTTLAIAPSQPSTIYALAADGNLATPLARGLLAVFRSTATGDPGSWTTQASSSSPSKVSQSLLSIPFGVAADVCSGGTPAHGGQGDYDNVIAVDPTNPNLLFAGGIDVFRSEDGGVTWGIVMYWDAAKNTAHADNHAIVFHPGWNGTTNQTLFLGNDGGVWQTDNASDTAATAQNAGCSTTGSNVVWKSLNNGYATTQFYFGAVYPGGAAYLGGLQDNGTLRGTAGRGANWDLLFTGDGGDVAIDRSNLNVMYYEVTSFFLIRTLDGGENTTSAVNGITESAINFNFIAQFVLDPNNSQRLYGGGKSLWRSDDSASNWTAVSAPFPFSIARIAVAPQDSSRMLVAVNDGTVYSNKDALNSTSSTKWTGTKPRTGIPSALAFDPGDSAIAYVGYSTYNSSATDAHIYKTTDGGATWRSLDISGAAGSVDVPVNSIAVDPLNTQNVYLGTDLGLLLSTDGGRTWAADQNGFGNAIVTDLILDRGAGTTDLYAFTFGSGVWKLSIPNSGAPCTYSVSPVSLQVPALGGVFQVNVTAGDGCVWASVPNGTRDQATWLTPQPPSLGTGSGIAKLVVAPNLTPTSRQDQVYVQQQAVTVNQDAPVSATPVNDAITGAFTLTTAPYSALESNSILTSNAADPIHSCTGAADFRTAWWKFTPTTAGTVQISAIGQQNITGAVSNGGAVLAVFAANGSAVGPELGCATAPRDSARNLNLVPALVTLQVTAGTAYFIEVSSIAASTMVYQMSVSTTVSTYPAVRIAPELTGMGPGQTLQFNAKVTGSDTAVRWQISPSVGNISSTGLYTAPPTLTASQTVNVTAVLLANPLIAASTTLTINPPGSISFSADSIGNVWSGRGGSVSPGEVAVIYGANLGPSALVTATLTPDKTHFNTSAGTTQVMFDGVPAPIIYSYAGAVSVTVPYEVAGKASTKVQVLYNGQSSPVATVPVSPATPGILTGGTTGAGQAVLFNQDQSFNSAGNPAAPGSIVTLYLTGEGLTTPADTGLINSLSFPSLNLPVTISIGGADAKVNYVSEAPGIISGVALIQAIVPKIPASNTASLVVTIGGISSQPGVTICVSAQ